VLFIHKRGNDHYSAVPPQQLPLLQMVLSALPLPSQSFSCPGQLQVVRGTDRLYPVSPARLYPVFQAGKKPAGVSFIDSTPLKVCHNRFIYNHKVFKTYVARGKSSTGWFYGFKLHLIINDCREICSFCLTPGNVDDWNADVIDHLCRELKGKLFGDRGYIYRELFERLYERGIQLVTRLRKHMKNVLMDMRDKLLLRKRTVIESVNDFLKNICQVEHSRYRSPINFLVKPLAALSAYSFPPHKPSIWGFQDARALPLLV
jgi:hypothetical protein